MATATTTAPKKETTVTTAKKEEAQTAISTRDFFAGMAMSQLINDRGIIEKSNKTSDPMASRVEFVSDLAYKFADEMLAKSKK